MWCLTILSRDDGFTTFIMKGRGAQCVCGASNRHSDSVLTESKGSGPCAGPLPGEVKLRETGKKDPERRRLTRSLIAANMCPTVFFGWPVGDFEDSARISTPMPPWRHPSLIWVSRRYRIDHLKLAFWAFLVHAYPLIILTLHFVEFHE